jgi:hypothetical protein
VIVLMVDIGRIDDHHCLNFLFVIVDLDLTYSRTPVEAICTSLSGCKCNTAKCYFGDPCLCSKCNECGIGQFINDKGGKLTLR